MRFYRITDVKLVCESIYKGKISDRTWRRWKNALGFEKYSKFISEPKMEQLLTFTNLKCSQPYDKITLEDVIKSKLKTLIDFQETRSSYIDHLLPDSCEGIEIPNIIKVITGRKISKKTLYRQSTKFRIKYSTNKIYSKDELKEYISLGFVKPNAEKADNIAGSLKT